MKYSHTQVLTRLGIDRKDALSIIHKLAREAPRSCEWAENETLYRPQNRLADMAMGVVPARADQE